jgi:hypothetical protein
LPRALNITPIGCKIPANPAENVDPAGIARLSANGHGAAQAAYFPLTSKSASSPANN